MINAKDHPKTRKFCDDIEKTALAVLPEIIRNEFDYGLDGLEEIQIIEKSVAKSLAIAMEFQKQFRNLENGIEKHLIQIYQQGGVQ